jgi:hypothetical protein
MPSTDSNVLIGLFVPINLILFCCCFAGVAVGIWKYRLQPPPQPEKRGMSVIEQMRAAAEEPPPLKIRVPVSIKLTK